MLLWPQRTHQEVGDVFGVGVGVGEKCDLFVRVVMCDLRSEMVHDVLACECI